MRNAVGKDSSTLRTIILYTFGLLTFLFVHDTFFQLRQINQTSNFSCARGFTKPFMKPDAERRQEGYRIPKSESYK
jgi:hypothetical protein